MSYREAKTLTARGQIQLKFAKRAAKLVNVFQCLIVSADPARRELLERAASEGGWKAFPCGDAPSALNHVSRTAVQLAVVDFESQSSDLFRPVVEKLTSSSGLLLIVCGNEGNEEEEIWVRQRGVWLYLPGVVETSNIKLLCGEARHIAERLWKSSNPERGAGSPVSTAS